MTTRIADVHALEGAQATYYRALFALVQNEEHWKNPVDVVVPNQMVSDVQRAVEFMTATEAEVYEAEPTPHPTQVVTRRDYRRVRAIGYLAGPAGP